MGGAAGGTAENYGGDVYLDLDEGSWKPKLKMKGNPVAGDLYLAAGKVITVTGAFTEGTDIAVSIADGSGVFTSGYSEYNEAAPYQYFRAFDTSKGVLLTDGEAALETGVVNKVSYVERSWNGTEVVFESKTRDAVEVPTDGKLTSGWYYLNRDVTMNGRIESITGDVNLILGDGYTLDVKGLYVPANTTLTIYGQSGGTGKIYSHPSGGARIGGGCDAAPGTVIVNGGAICGSSSSRDYDGVAQGSIIRLSGNVQISGDEVDRKNNNVHLDKEKGYGPLVLIIAGHLTNTVPIPVSVEDDISAETPQVITDGLAGNGTAERELREC